MELEPETLDNACEALENEIKTVCDDLDASEAAEIFSLIWKRLTLDVWNEEGKAAIALVEERYNI